MEYRNKMLGVTKAELLELMRPGTLNGLLYKKIIVPIKRGGGAGGYALYAWTSIPERYKLLYRERFGDPEEAVRRSLMKETVKIDDAARKWFEDYRYMRNGEVVSLTEKLKTEYVMNASVLKELIHLKKQRCALISSLNGKASDVWRVVFESSEKMREIYDHTLPTSANRLKLKIKSFEQTGYASLVSGKVGNINTIKITDEFGEVLIALKRSRVPVYTDRQLFDRGNEIALAHGWKPLKSLSGMKRWLHSPSIIQLWHDAEYGEQKTRQKFGRKHKTAMPTKRDALWYGDGTRLNLYYQDEDGRMKTTQVYEVIDAMSEVMLGYWISDHEDYEAQYNAYRMAIQTSGYKPYEIVYDNQGGHKKLNKKRNRSEEGFLDKICHLHRATQPYNGESKIIEHVFSRFQQEVLHKNWRFTGQNITAVKENSRPNLEFVEANQRDLYTLEELKEAYAAAREEWNNMKHPKSDKSRMEMYLESVNEATQKVTVYDMIDMFWVEADRMSTFTDYGITVTIKGKKYQYEVFSSPGVPDHDWRMKHTFERFVVKYDPNAPSSIRLYSKDADGSLRFERVANPYIVIPRAIQEQTSADAAFIRQEQQANMQDRIERQVAGKLIEKRHGVLPEQHGLQSPNLKGVSKEVQEQIDRRVGIYSTSAKPKKRVKTLFKIGEESKRVSLEGWEDDRVCVDRNRTAGKL